MKHRFLIHPLNHTFLLIDITGIAIPTRIIPAEGETQTVPTLRFRRWTDVEMHLLGLGSNAGAIESAMKDLKKANAAVLTIV